MLECVSRVRCSLGLRGQSVLRGGGGSGRRRASTGVVESRGWDARPARDGRCPSSESAWDTHTHLVGVCVGHLCSEGGSDGVAGLWPESAWDAAAWAVTGCGCVVGCHSCARGVTSVRHHCRDGVG